MGSILLLYDTVEKDLARDFKDFLAEVGIDIKMIPSLPDLGKTLQGKEEKYINSCDGMIFLITPGSERMGKLFPSPSVADEMGQAKQKFKNRPERLVYLVDKKCNIHAIDQKSYIPFDRNDFRSILECLTQLIKNLKQSELLGRKKIEQRETPSIDISKYSESINATLKDICFDLSDQPNGLIGLSHFDNLLKTKYKKSNRDINFIKRELGAKGLVKYDSSRCQLSEIGFELVKHEMGKKRGGLLKDLLVPSPPFATHLGSLR